MTTFNDNLYTYSAKVLRFIWTLILFGSPVWLATINLNLKLSLFYKINYHGLLS